MNSFVSDNQLPFDLKMYDEDGKEITNQNVKKIIWFFTIIFTSGNGISAFYLLERSGYKVSGWISYPLAFVIGFLCEKVGVWYVTKFHSKELRIYNQENAKMVTQLLGSVIAGVISIIANFLIALIVVYFLRK